MTHAYVPPTADVERLLASLDSAAARGTDLAEESASMLRYLLSCRDTLAESKDAAERSQRDLVEYARDPTNEKFGAPMSGHDCEVRDVIRDLRGWKKVYDELLAAMRTSDPVAYLMVHDEMKRVLLILRAELATERGEVPEELRTMIDAALARKLPPATSVLPRRSEVTRAWITETCIANRGRWGAIKEATDRLQLAANDVFEGWGDRFRGDAKLHFVLQIERPTENTETA
jgi:hypothetical protein